MLMQATRPRGRAISDLLGLPTDTGQFPARPNWEVNPSLGGGPDKVRPGGAILKSITASGSLDPTSNGSMARFQLADGSIQGERLPDSAVMPGDQPDYGAILTGLLGPRPKMSTGQKIASVVGPALMAASGNQAMAMQAMGNIGSAGREWDARNREAQMTALSWKREDDQAEAKRNEPRFLSGNTDQVRYDPATGTSTRIYDAPEDFEDYAASKGLEPGTDDYFTAVEDYVLRGNGPTAFKYDRDLEAVRNAARIALEGERQRNRLAVEDTRQANRSALRGQPTYRDLNPAPRSTKASKRTATDGKGRKMEWNGSAWVLVK
ncbi:MAG: hypothetical protein VX512_12385 [Pseudomonadota bacterium]|nr:hypothetical protein [Pseudomonadota bacterium]